MPEPWNEGVRGTQALPLINVDAPVIRVEAGPGTGKTFGLVRRVSRIVHPEGLSADPHDVLVVAFNRVIAKQLHAEIAKQLKGGADLPLIRTVHALCLQALDPHLRLLLPHEREAMLYDVRQQHQAIRNQFDTFERTEQALRDHEAGHAEHLGLWQGVQRWLTRHRAELISQLPRLVLAELEGGGLEEMRFGHVIVDEFQDLTEGEQKLFVRMLRPEGQFLALGDPRQSIYLFRGNDRLGLDKLDALFAPRGVEVTSIPMTECQRCPSTVVRAANGLMQLYGAVPMVPGNEQQANVHRVHWNSPAREAAGMARAIVDNFRGHPDERHLVMVTRRQFGYELRDRMAELDAGIRVELTFSEGLLETWAAREAFLFFCLLFDPDAPTWRGWLGYCNSVNGKNFKATQRNADAYLRLLQAHGDQITSAAVETLAGEPREQHRGSGGRDLWDRAARFVQLRDAFGDFGDMSAIEIIASLFSPTKWTGAGHDDQETAVLDLQLLRARADELASEHDGIPADEVLRTVARQLRYQIATREPFAMGDESGVQVATLWGAKGITADHVYILGLCREAVPGQRRDEYPGTHEEYLEEQRRLFYVSITRTTKTLVLSRATSATVGEARHLGLAARPRDRWRVTLRSSPFVDEISQILPDSIPGDAWGGCAEQPDA